MSALSAAAVPVLRVVRGETRHPDPAGGGQNDPGQQHALRDPPQTSAGQSHSGEGRPGNVSTLTAPLRSGVLKQFEGDDAVIKPGWVLKEGERKPEMSFD